MRGIAPAPRDEGQSAVTRLLPHSAYLPSAVATPPSLHKGGRWFQVPCVGAQDSQEALLLTKESEQIAVASAGPSTCGCDWLLHQTPRDPVLSPSVPSVGTSLHPDCSLQGLMVQQFGSDTPQRRVPADTTGSSPFCAPGRGSQGAVVGAS